MPSDGTLVAFLCMVVIGLWWTLAWRGLYCGTSFAVACIGASAVAGHALDSPAWYFFDPSSGWTNGMALNTAVCLLALGLAGFIEIGRAHV